MKTFKEQVKSVGLLPLALLLALGACAALADEDDGAVGLTVRVSEGPLPGEITHEERRIIPAHRTDPRHPVILNDDGSLFRHVHRVSGDEDGCIFTGRHEGDHWTDFGASGRSCNQSAPHCGYIAEGYAVLGIAASCEDAGIALCQGLWCE